MHKCDIHGERGTAIFVVNHAKWQGQRGRRQSEPLGTIRDPRAALIAATHIVSRRCGCGGGLTPKGCSRFLMGDSFDLHTIHEEMMRDAGLGFGSFLSPEDAVMCLHLQEWGMTPGQSRIAANA